MIYVKLYKYLYIPTPRLNLKDWDIFYDVELEGYLIYWSGYYNTLTGDCSIFMIDHLNYVNILPEVLRKRFVETGRMHGRTDYRNDEIGIFVLDNVPRDKAKIIMKRLGVTKSESYKYPPVVKLHKFH